MEFGSFNEAKLKLRGVLKPVKGRLSTEGYALIEELKFQSTGGRGGGGEEEEEKEAEKKEEDEEK